MAVKLLYIDSIVKFQPPCSGVVTATETDIFALAFGRFLANKEAVAEAFCWNTRLWWCQGSGCFLELHNDGTYTVVAIASMRPDTLCLPIPVLNEDEYKQGDFVAAVRALRHDLEAARCFSPRAVG